jgi:hypothetical protein
MRWLPLLLVALTACSEDSEGSAAGGSGGGGASDAAAGSGGSAASGGTGAAGSGGTGASGGSSASGGSGGSGASAAGAAGAPSNGDTFLPWEGGAEYYAKWSNGPPSDPSFFPIAVWLQSPSRAAEYKSIGINVFIGLWQGPTDQQLSGLASAGMPTICEQSGVWASHLADPTIWAWMHGDEPDNAQSDGQGGYLPCIAPSSIIADYQQYVANDATRPVYLNLGKGVSQEDWIGRGDCTGRLDMYPEYIKGADIVSYDIYPVNDTDSAVHDNLWYVPRGVDRLREYAQYKKPVWNWIETTGFNDPANTPTPDQVKTEVWMSLIHGSLGIGYFAHIFQPTTVEAGLLASSSMKSAVSAINGQIRDLAPVLNTPSLSNGASVDSSNTNVPVDIMVKRQGSLYIFAVAMRSGSTNATFTVRTPTQGSVTVLGESRTLDLANGSFTDAFAPYAVHLYEITPG